jgi:chemotaxis protein histidine kinase CheA
MDDLLSDFATEAHQALAETRAALARGDAGRLDAARRLHGLKGAAACLRLRACETAAHEAETGLAEGRDIAPILERLARLAGDAAASPPPGASTLADAFSGLEAMTRDLGLQLGKRVELVLRGAELPLAPEAVRPLRQALIALIRNACDHGVETAAERAAKRKPAVAVLRLTARTRGEDLYLDFSDDGRGLDTEAVLRQGAVMGLLPAGLGRDAELGLGATEAQRMIFEAGLSTAFSVTPVSGRGMGLDLVRDAIERLGGRIETASTPGRGAAFTLFLPAAPEKRRRQASLLRGAA